METALIGPISLVPSYVYWHYAKAAKHIWRLTTDFSWFLWHFFSIGLLARTFFKPWWREAEQTRFGIAIFFSLESLGEYISSKTTNFIVMLFGVVVRSVMIVLGLAAEILLWLVASVFFIVWLILPVIAVFLVFAGIVFIFRPM